MKKTFVLLAGIIIGSLVLEGCKKGENDPFLTLSSRRARLAGDWKMTKLEMTQTSTDASGTDTYVYTSDGSTRPSPINTWVRTDR